ncbi:hypothetical protein U1Q18_010740 [Sarracenia purpurea var. burkii]
MRASKSLADPASKSLTDPASKSICRLRFRHRLSLPVAIEFGYVYQNRIQDAKEKDDLRRARHQPHRRYGGDFDLRRLFCEEVNLSNASPSLLQISGDKGSMFDAVLPIEENHVRSIGACKSGSDNVYKVHGEGVKVSASKVFDLLPQRKPICVLAVDDTGKDDSVGCLLLLRQSSSSLFFQIDHHESRLSDQERSLQFFRRS